MANQIRYQVGFNVNKSDLNQIKSSLQQLQKVKLDDIMKINKTDINSARDALKSIQEDASKVESALNKAFNTKLNTLNIDKFNKQLSSSNLTIQKVYQSFSRAGTAGQSAFNSLSTQILNTNVQLRQSNKLLDSMATSMANTVKWGITSSVFNNMTRSIQQAYYYAKDLDKSLTNIRIVTGDSADQMQRFATTANNAAKELGRSTLDYTKASLTFYQQGLDDQQVAARTEATLKAQNITGIGTEMADYLTAVWNGFNVGAEEAENYVDKLAAVADSTASDMGQLATAMSKVASAANSIGVDMDQLNGQIATVIATTRQAPESVGAAFKTIYARINDIKAGTDDAQVSLGNYSGKMAGLGINVLDATGHLRDTGEVIEEIGGKWQSLTREQQINLAQTMAGQRQYNNLIALFDNWDKYLQSVNTSMDAQGTLNEKNDRYLESLEAHMQQLGTQAERTYDILFDENTVKGWVDALNGALNIFNDFIGGIGGGTTAFTYFGSLIAGIFNKQIAQAIQGVGVEINRFKANLGSIAAKQQIIDNIKSNIQASYAGEGKNIGDVALKTQAEAAQKTLAVQKGLTIEQQKQAVQIQKQIGLSQQKLNDLKKQQDEANKIVKDLQQQQVIQGRSIALLQQDQQRLQTSYNLNQKSLTTMESISKSIDKINSGNLTWQQHQQTQKTLLQQIDNESDNLRDTWVAAVGSSEGFEKHIKIVKQYLSGGNVSVQDFQRSWKSIESVTRTYANNQKADLGKIDLYLKNIGIDTSKLTEEEKKRLSILLQQNDALAEQGKKTLNLQTLIKGMSSAGQILSSWAGAAKTFGDEMATAQQKANATISSIQGTISGVGTMFGPIGMGIATLANGAISLIKEITPIGDLIEGLFESTRDKIDEFNQSLSEIGKQEQSTNQKIGSLQAIAQEYETLSNKVQAYGGSLNALTEEQKNRYHELTDEFAQYNESIIVGYDNQGHAIVKNQQGIKQTIQLLRDQQREAARTKLGDTGQALQIKNSELGLSIEEATTAKETAITSRETFESALKDYQNILNNDIILLQEELSNSGKLFEQQALIPFLKTVTGQNLDLSFLQNSDNLKNVNDYLLALQKAILDDPEILKDQNVLKVYQTFFKELSEVDQIASSSSSLPGINNFISNFVQSSQQTKKAIETAQSNLTAAQQSLKSGQIKFDSSFIMQMLQYGEGYSDQFEQLESLDLYDQDIYNTIVDALSGWTFTKNLERDVENKTAHSYQQVLEFGRVYIQSLVTTLSELGTEINTAKQKSAKDLEKIANGEDKTSKELIEVIIKSIQSNWLNDPAILEALKDPGQGTSIINLIKNLYGLENFAVDQNGVIQQVETAATQAAAEIKAALVKGLFEGVSAESLFSGEVPQIPEEDLGKFLDQFGAEQIIALNKAFKQKQPEIKGLDDFKTWALNYFKELNEAQFSDNLAKNFDKVINIIQKLQTGKDLSYKEKLNLMQYLGLNEDDVQDAETILAKFRQQIAKLTGLQRYKGLQKIFTDFDTLKQYKDDFNLSNEQKSVLWQDIFDKQVEAIGMQQNQLRQWAINRGMILESAELDEDDWEKILGTAKMMQQAEGLKGLAEKFVDENGKIKKDIDTTSQDFLKLQTAINELTGQNYDASTIKTMIEGIVAWTDDGSQSAEQYLEWLKQLFNFKTEDLTAGERYKEDKTSVNNLEGASKSLTDRSTMSQDQSAALGEILAIDQNLAKIAEQQGINSKDFLEALNAIIEAKKQELQIDKQAALAENERDIRTAEMIKKSAEIRGHTEKVTEQEQKLNELYAQRAQLMQQTEAPEYDADINVQELEHLSDTIQQIAPQSEELANSLAEDEDAANDLAQAVLRFDDACKDVADNYENWMAALNSGSLQDQVQAMDGLRDAYADLLDMDGDSFSQSFLSSAENLNLMKAAIDGDIDAYNQLMNIAQQDIETTVGITVDDTEFWNAKSQVESAMDQMNFENIEIGASLNVGDFYTQLESMINAAGMTAKQATDYLASMGIDAEVIETDTEAEQNSQALEYNSTLTPNTQTVTDTVLTNDGEQLSGKTVEQSVTSWDQNVEATPVSGTAKKENKAFSLKVISANKSSGGGFKFKNATNGGGSKGNTRRSSPSKGSGSKPKKSSSKPRKSATKKPTTKKEDTSTKDLKKGLEDQRDIYHDINIQIEQIDRNLDRVQKKQDRLYGKELINNLNEQQQLLEKQKKTLAEKLKLQEQDLKNQRSKLRGLDVEFDSEGKIANYMQVLLNKQDQVNNAVERYNDLVNAYNSMTDPDAKDALSKQIDTASDQVQDLKNEFKDLEDRIKNYDDLREDMADLVDEVEELTQQQIEIEIKKFRMKVDIHLEMGEAEREWNQFRRKVIERPDYMKSSNFDEIFAGATQDKRDISSYFNVNNSGTGSIETLTKQLLDTKKAIEEIDETGTSAIYGDNKELAMQHLQKDLKELMTQLENIEDLIDNIDKAYLETIDDIQKNFDKQIEDYQFVGDLIDHDIDLLTILYGDKNYDAMDKYYTALEQNNNKELDSLKKQADWWKKQWDAAKANEDWKAAEKFEAAYRKTIKSLNSQIQESAKVIQQKYENAINKIFDTLDKKISGGKGTDYLSMEWELMNKNEEQYLDTVNSAFAIQETQRKYSRALNETKSIKNQQALKKLMDEQLSILKNKNKLTQYDIDRAEKLLQIEQARIALEQTRSAKTSMRLKRNSQGNYSYEYVADQNGVGDAEEALAKAQNDLYNFDKDAYKQNLEDMLSAWKDYLSKRKEILLNYNLTEAQQKEQLALLDEQYGEYINGKTEQNLNIRENLTESAFTAIAGIYGTDVDNYRGMTDAQKTILMQSLIPAWDGGVQHMANTFTQQGGLIPTCKSAFDDLATTTSNYGTSLETMATKAGIDLDNVKSGVDELATSFSSLIEPNDQLIDRMDQQVTAIGKVRDEAKLLVDDYKEVAAAAIAAVSQIQELMQTQRQEARVAAETAETEKLIEDTGKSSTKSEGKSASKSNDSNGLPTFTPTVVETVFTVSKKKKTNSNSNNNSYTPSSVPTVVSTPKVNTPKKKKIQGLLSKIASKNKDQIAYNKVANRQQAKLTKNQNLNYKKKRNFYPSLDTGGYTGDWNSNEGRLAVLHQKELVLNKADTENFLSGISILREINSSLNGNMFSMLNSLSSNRGFDSSSDVLEQNVHIDASFPNVNSKKEIEEAFSELVNMAAQRAMRR